MDEERRIICAIIHSEIETLKDVFDKAVFEFYRTYDGRVSLRREKIVKYLSLISDLIERTKENVEVINNE